MKPPALIDSDFDSVATGNEQSIFARFQHLVLEEFVPYLNEILHGLQPLRAKVCDKERDLSSSGAFSKHPQRLRTGENFWYIYNEGGRAEIQFHLGMTPIKVFIGLAFNMEPQAYGEPQKVRDMLEAFRLVVLNNKDDFLTFAGQHKIMLEWEPVNGPGGSRRDKDILNFLEHHSLDLKWVFVGAILRKEHDREILENPDKLDKVMRTVLNGLWPYYEKTLLSYWGLIDLGKTPVVRIKKRPPAKPRH